MKKGYERTPEIREKNRASHRSGPGSGWPKGKPRPKHLSTAHSAFMKSLWQDPEFRARGVEHMRKIGAALRENQKNSPAVRRHGLTLAQRNSLRARLCEVCGAQPPSHIDHNHVTTVVRGALCGNCNRALGIMREDVGLILKLADYVAKYEWKLTDVFDIEHTEGYVSSE